MTLLKVSKSKVKKIERDKVDKHYHRHLPYLVPLYNFEEMSYPVNSEHKSCMHGNFFFKTSFQKGELIIQIIVHSPTTDHLEKLLYDV